MQADLIFIGSELLTGLVENTNAVFLSRRLWAEGIAVRTHRVVADEPEEITAALKESLAHSEVIICSGGLGPTGDDLTREAVAALLGRRLYTDKAWLDRLETFFAARGYRMPVSNRKQAMVIEGGSLLDNPLGTAPGMLISCGERLIFLLPGPPMELQPMFESLVLPLLRKKRGETGVAVRTLKCIGLGESLLEEKIAPPPAQWSNPSLSLVARGMEVHLQLKASGTPAAVSDLLDNAEQKLRDALGRYVYGRGEDTLASVTGRMLAERSLTIAAAESCSGGLLADTITEIPGSSNYFKGAAVTYDTGAKSSLLEVPPQLVDREGVVSAAVAEAMAQGARRLFGCDLGLGITGVAGPGGGTPKTPVGLVYVAIAGKDFCQSKELRHTGTRRAIKERAVQGALYILWRVLTENAPKKRKP